MTKCLVDWCNSHANVKGMCDRHRRQQLKNGKVARSRFDPNVINDIGDDTLEIELRNRNGHVVARTIVNKSSRGIVDQHIWFYHNGYARTQYRGKTISMHMFLVKSDEQVDHINRDKLDNRISNLRPCSHRQNNINHPVRRDNTSGAIGVSWHNGHKKWHAHIRIDGKQVHCGYFKNKADAIQSRLMAEANHYKEFSPQARHESLAI